MPNIRTYDAGVIGARPTETGIEARAATARRIGTFYNQEAGATQALGKEVEQLGGTEQRTLTAFGKEVGGGIEAAGGEAVKYITHRELSQGARDYTGMVAGLEKEWTELSKRVDPNDPSVAERFRTERLEPEIEKFKSTFLTEGGQKFAEGHTDHFRTHMFTKTTADMASLAGIAAKDNIHKMVNNLSMTVMSDPSSLDFALRTLDGAVGAQIDSSPTLGGVAAAHARSEISTRAKEDIVKAAAFGFIMRTGNVPGWASDPKYAPYLKATEIKQFESMARTEQRNRRIDADHARKEQEHVAGQDFERKANQLEFDMMPKELGDSPTLPPDWQQRMRELMVHPGAETKGNLFRTLTHRITAVTEKLNKVPVSDAISVPTEYDFRRRMATDSDYPTTDEAWEAWRAGKLKTPVWRTLLRDIEQGKSGGDPVARERNKFFSTISKDIDPAGSTPAGKIKMLEALADARFQEENLRKQGINPHLLYQEGKEHYIGTPAWRAKYHVPFDVGIRSMVAPAAPVAPDAAPPPVGFVTNGGLRFKGGDPYKPENWEKVR